MEKKIQMKKWERERIREICSLLMFYAQKSGSFVVVFCVLTLKASISSKYFTFSFYCDIFQISSKKRKTKKKLITTNFHCEIQRAQKGQKMNVPKWFQFFSYIIFFPQINSYYFQLFASLRKALIIEMKCTSTFPMFNVQSPFRCVYFSDFANHPHFTHRNKISFETCVALNIFEYGLCMFVMFQCCRSYFILPWTMETNSNYKVDFESVSFVYVSEMLFYQAEKPCTLFIVHR